MTKRIPNGLDTNRSKVLEVALSKVGTREATGKNDGPVEEFMPKWARGKGLPYCAWFVAWCFNQALGKYPYGASTPIGAVSALYAAGRKLDEALDLNAPWPALRPQPGDIFIVLHEPFVEGKHIPGHTGLILRVDEETQRVNTVEGNFENRVAVATRALNDFESVLNPYGRLANEHSSAGWERGIIEAPLAGGLKNTR